jgi:pimeloyl-ACP methyl ester carboxylesterase
MKTFSLFALIVLAQSPAQAADCVVFLHGLARTSASMEKAATAFATSGYTVANVSYPSRKFPIEELAPLAIEAGLEKCPANGTVHFVTHSLGGILVRYYLEHNEISNLGRVLMLAPPNQGSAVVDSLRHFPGFKVIHGPAGLQLGTREDSIPLMLGPVDYEVGIIAGTKTFNPILSQYLQNPDDGKVSVENTKVQGMTDFVVVPHSHPFIMKSSVVIEQAFSFIETGRFEHAAP